MATCLHHAHSFAHTSIVIFCHSQRDRQQGRGDWRDLQRRQAETAVTASLAMIFGPALPLLCAAQHSQLTAHHCLHPARIRVGSTNGIKRVEYISIMMFMSQY